MRPNCSIKTVFARTLARAWADSRGATAVEYGLILALVVLSLVVGLSALGGSTTGLWGGINTKVAQAR